MRKKGEGGEERDLDNDSRGEEGKEGELERK